MAASKTSRYGFIDAIRGLAACCVMLQHSLYQSGLLGGRPPEKLTGFIPTWLELGETGVVAFFLVSGFVIPLSLEKTAQLRLFWIHRVLRIYPLYIAIFALTFLVTAGGQIHSFDAFIVNFVSHMLFIQEYTNQEGFVGGAWTLSLEMVWYISISLAFLLSLNKRTNLLVAVTVMVSVVAQLSCAAHIHLPMGRLSMLVCCVFGLVCYRRQQESISRSHFAALSAVLAATIAINLFVGLQLFPAANPTASFPMAIDSWALAAVVFFVPFALRNASIWNHSLLSFLGQISYSVYLVHPVVLFLLSSTAISGPLLIVVTFTVTIGVSTLTYRLVESPPIRFGHSLRPVRPQPAT
jgi:peptidoglycan/LPS O-acetylase OafA/YrhL